MKGKSLNSKIAMGTNYQGRRIKGDPIMYHLSSLAKSVQNSRKLKDTDVKRERNELLDLY